MQIPAGGLPPERKTLPVWHPQIRFGTPAQRTPTSGRLPLTRGTIAQAAEPLRLDLPPPVLLSGAGGHGIGLALALMASREAMLTRATPPGFGERDG